jgi:hypothetical protein
MNYKGIEFKLLQTTTPDVWAWSFDPPESVPVQGKAKGSRAMALIAVQRAINRWLKSSREEAQC